METYTTMDFLDNCKGRVWLIEPRKKVLYDALFNNEYYKFVSTQRFKTTYRDYTYNITLVEFKEEKNKM